jgi:PhnB protein
MNKKVNYIPEGFHTLTPFLVIKDAAHAIRFYQEAFGAKVLEQHHGPDGKIVHAALQIGNSPFMLADEFPEWGCGMLSPSSLKGTSVSLHVYVKDVDAAFDKATKAGAQVKMPLEDTFWGDRYGQLEDPFGHVWSFATHKVDVSPEEIAKKGKESMQEKSKAK